MKPPGGVAGGITSAQLVSAWSEQYSTGTIAKDMGGPFTVLATLYRPLRTQNPGLAPRAPLVELVYAKLLASVTESTATLVPFMALPVATNVVMTSPTTRPWFGEFTVTMVAARVKLPDTHLRYEPAVAATVADASAYVNVVLVGTDATATQVALSDDVPVTYTLSEVVRPCGWSVVAETVVPVCENVPIDIISGRPNTAVLALAGFVR